MKLDYDSIKKERTKRRAELDDITKKYYNIEEGLEKKDDFFRLCADELKNAGRRSSGMEVFVHAWSSAELAEQLAKEFSTGLDIEFIKRMAYSHELLEDAWCYSSDTMAQKRGDEKWKPYADMLDSIVLLSVPRHADVVNGRKCKAYQVSKHGKKKAELAYVLIAEALDNMTDISYELDKDRLLSRHVASLITYVNTLNEYIPELVKPITDFAEAVEKNEKLTQVKEYLSQFNKFKGRALRRASNAFVKKYLSNQ